MTLLQAFSSGFKMIFALFCIIFVSIVLAVIANLMLWFIPTVIQSIVTVFVLIGSMVSLVVYFVEKGNMDL